MEKLCECGCGSPTGIAKRSGRNGVKKGDRLRFLPHHSGPHAARTKPSFHGMTNTPTFKTWLGMMYRCVWGHVQWHNYGGRGIGVCESWREFKNFLADMGARPGGMTLDRLDPDGNYEPTNCRWATLMEQHANYRNNRLLTHDGKTQHVAAWARDIGINRATLRQRLDRGWSIADAVTKGPQR